VLIEILDRLVERYLLSPYLTDIAFWGLFSLLPAVILIAWTHGKPGKDQATTAEKVGVPINVIATLGLLITVFGGKDLGARADLVTLSNELGQTEKHYIPRDSYRRRMAVFFWNNKSGQSEYDWLQYGVTELLMQDLQQNPFLLVTSPWANRGNGYYLRMKQAGFDKGVGLPLNLMREIADEANRQYFAEGELSRSGSDFVIIARVWETETLTLLGEVSEQGADLLPLVDRVSSGLRTVLDVPSGTGRLAEDLPLTETYGESEKVLSQYINGRNALLFQNDWVVSNQFYDQVLKADANFVLAWFHKAINLVDQGDIPGAQKALAEAQKRDYRLPTHDKANLKAATYRLSGEQDKLGSFLRMQVKLQGSAEAQRNLANFLYYTGRLEDAKDEFKQVQVMDAADLTAVLHLANLERATGNLPEALNYARSYLEAKPQNTQGMIFLGDLYLQSGDFEAASEQYFQAQLIEDPPLRSVLRQGLVALKQGEWGAVNDSLQQARQLDTGPAGQSAILVMQGLLEFRLGKIRQAIEVLELQTQSDELSKSPMNRVFSYTFPFVQYNLLIGEFDEAQQALDLAMESVQPPLNQFLAFSEVSLLAAQGEFDAALQAIDRGRDVIDRFKAKYIEFQIPLSEAIVAAERGDFPLAAEKFSRAIEQAERSTAGGELLFRLSDIYGACADMYVRSGDLKKAQVFLDQAFAHDPSEPSLWVARARLQKERGMEEMASASINYALAIWKEADPEYRHYREALEFRDSLSIVVAQAALSD
jgi:tetratricopeptide (TPR) repeat protein